MTSRFRQRWLAVVAAGAGLFAASGHAAEKLKADVVVARHLEAVGTVEARAAVRHRLATGTSTMRVVVGSTLSYQGRARVVSDPRRFKVALPFLDPT